MSSSKRSVLCLNKYTVCKCSRMFSHFFQSMKIHDNELFEFILVTTGQEAVSKPQGKAELRKQYLLEKYVWKWKQFMRSRKGEGLFPRLLKLSHNNWLRQVQRKIKKIYLKYNFVASILLCSACFLCRSISIFC